ncbi:C40 family peptidase [Nonomuraea sp. NPDC048881]|uniref:C40 family peptidase n=1 Tax=Nonomuraea sp. NPDC048881 TaxID=3155030 RepID=UPI0033E36D80
MPWPPSGYIEPSVDLGTQLASPVTPGLESPVQDPAAISYNPSSGVVAPGVNAMWEPDFSALPDPKEDNIKIPTTGKTRELVIQYALEKLGRKYVWGGESDAEGGFDCSGLLFYAFHKAGVDMPRVSYSQTGRGKRVSLDKLEPGDLVAWDSNPSIPGADHIALYLGNGEIVEAPATWVVVNGKRVRGTVRRRKLGANEGAWGVKLSY